MVLGAPYKAPMMVVIAPKPEVRESNCAILVLRSVSPRNPIRAKPVNVKQSALLNDIRATVIGFSSALRNGSQFREIFQFPRYWLSVSRPKIATIPPQKRAAARFDADFREMRHSDMAEIVSAKQNTVAIGIAAKFLNNSMAVAQVVSAKQQGIAGSAMAIIDRATTAPAR